MNNLQKELAQLINKQKYTQAEILVSKALTDKPKDYNLLQVMGTIQCLQKKFESGLNYFNQSLDINPSQKAVCVNRIRCLLDLNHFAEAVQDCDQYLGRWPNETKFIEMKSRALRSLGKASEALAMLKKLSLNDRGLLLEHEKNLMALERYDEALKVLTQLKAQFPQDQVILHDYAVSLRAMGKPKAALEIYTDLINRGIHSYSVYHNAANALSDMGELTAAINLFQKALEFNPAYAPTHRNLNELLWEAGHKEYFLQSYLLLFQKNVVNKELLIDFAELALRAGQYPQAQNILEKYRNIGLSSPDYWSALGRAQEMQEDFISAKTSFEQMLDLKGVTGRQYARFARLLQKMGAYEEAAHILNNCSKIVCN